MKPFLFESAQLGFVISGSGLMGVLLAKTHVLKTR